MSELIRLPAVGRPLARLDGPAKVTGTAPYAYEHPAERPCYLHPVQATVARGRVTSFDTAAAEATDGVLAVITHRNAPRLASTEDAELAILQDDRVGFRGQFVAAVVAETPEVARHAAGLVRVEYDEQPHEVQLRADRDDLYAPEQVNPNFPTDTEDGDFDTAFAAADVQIDQTYTTPHEYNNPMEPHTVIAYWRDGELSMHDSTQSPHGVRATMSGLFGLAPERVHVFAPNVGGGFGSKGTPHAHDVLAALAARFLEGRPVKVALTRQQMFAVAGYRTPTIQRVRLGADADGRITAIGHDVIEQTSRIKEFAEQTAVSTRTMYASANRRTTHRLAALDVAVPSWMRAPGETPGMFAAEVAMDELAVACGLDPIELRARNEPAVDPDTGKPWALRHLVACLREGARRFGWEQRAAAPRSRLRDGAWVGLGVASATYPARVLPGSAATIRYGADGRYRVEIGAVDLGTGTWTVLTQVAADALDCPVDAVDLMIGDTALPPASVAGGSSGLTSWGSTICAAAQAFRGRYGTDPAPGDEATAGMPEGTANQDYALHSFGAHFVEVRVDADTAEIRVPRMLGVFSVGRIVNPVTARSQFLGGMTMGLSMALHEQGVLDPRFGHIVNHDFAEYHIATHADVGDLEAVWLDEHDPQANPLGAHGIGEIGIVGAAAAVANAVHDATGMRVRDLPITLDQLLPALD
ncbi:MAG: xanthine dehydrogenase family protein molybdopterin-binding subunit [Jatrophihabitantaceae bacterium]